MRHLGNQHGFLKSLLCIALLVIAGYSGIKFGMPHYRYSSFKYDAKDIARSELGNLEKIRAKAYETSQRLKIPIDEESIIVTKKGELIHIQASWSETVDIFGYYKKTLKFKIDIEE